MRNIVYILNLSLIILLSGSCYPTYTTTSTTTFNDFTQGFEARGKSFEGANVQQLLQSWGPATSITSDGGDGKIYTYKIQQQFSVGFYTGYNYFYVNNEGKVYHTKYRYTLN